MNMDELIDRAMKWAGEVAGEYSDEGEKLIIELVNRIKEIEIERDQFMEQASLRDQRDADLQQIMKINNELLKKVKELEAELTEMHYLS